MDKRAVAVTESKEEAHADGPAMPELILCRATLAFAGLRAGALVWVDPDIPYIINALRSRALVPHKDDDDAAE